MKFVSLPAIVGAIFLVSACQTDLAGMKLPVLAMLDTQSQSFNDTSFEMKSCEITPERSAVCKLLVTNQFRDKKLEIYRGITIQDNLGTDYPVTAGGFGDPSTRPQWNQIAVADSSYHLTVIATNLSTRATSVRAVIFPRLLVRSLQGQAIGYRDKVIFSKPEMVASGQGPATASPSAATQETANAGTTTESPLSKSPAASSAGSPTPTFKSDTWKVVGYWNYDASDGQYLAAQGLALRSVPGAGLGQQWQAHLELKNHASLAPRSRSLWPVKINTRQRKVCASYPGYPSYPAFIDMPGEAEDGVYLFSACNGE